MKKGWETTANSDTREMPQHARVPAEMHIGGVRIAPATVLAPMAGVTDTVFRRFIKNASMFTEPEAAFNQATDDSVDVDVETSNEVSGCGLIMTEFTSADGLSRMRETKRKRYLTYYEDEHPISAQLFGSNPETLAESAIICQDAGFDLVDLNLGCPAKRVVACNGGSGLLRDLPAIRKIFERVRAAVTIPFTVKFRMGWNDSNIVCVELAKMAEDCGLNAVALHARTREQGYTGEARWEWIAAVKDAVTIPVIGNGDVRTPEDAAAMVDATHCDAVMIGRAAPANPWIFRQIAQYTASKQATGVGTYDKPTDMDRYRMIRDYFERLMHEVAEHPEIVGPAESDLDKRLKRNHESAQRDAIGRMKQFASWFTHGVPGGSTLRKEIFDAKRGAQVMEKVEAFFTLRAEPQQDFSLEHDAELEAAPAAWG
ncbi:tRNA-dihydrouridine synthase [Granulicella sp. S156]|uniref:tRNA dihydrouridine synthase n=1 Tax=Granulicella sp. S156 TaxID=1747224 RepID=UPI00131C9127|nr:tRNA-dihydrouridine synthase [Granulicella sp. S156]